MARKAIPAIDEYIGQGNLLGRVDSFDLPSTFGDCLAKVPAGSGLWPRCAPINRGNVSLRWENLRGKKAVDEVVARGQWSFCRTYRPI